MQHSKFNYKLSILIALVVLTLSTFTVIKSTPAKAACSDSSCPGSNPNNCPGAACCIETATNGCSNGSVEWSCTQCGGCNCTPTCSAPSGLDITSPATNSTISINSVIRWSLASWGTDSSKSSCTNDQCNYTTHDNGTGSFQLFIDAINISDRCAEHTGSGDGAKIPEGTTQCTITGIDLSWLGTTRSIRIEATNKTASCGNVVASRSFNFAPNEKPFCNNYTVRGGRILKGNLAAFKEDQISITANGGDNDGYGLPKQIGMCYAIRNQPTSFYRIGGTGNAYVCAPSTNNSNTTSYTRSFQNLQSFYESERSRVNPSPDSPPVYTGSTDMDKDGFLIVTNVFDNIENRFCTTNVGFLNGNGWYWPTLNDTCNGGSCVLNIYNNKPEITSVTPSNTTYIGTAPDGDNGPSCSDNNPQIYRMNVRDLDGSVDIDRFGLSLAPPDKTGEYDSRFWPLRVMFAKKFAARSNQQFANNTFMIRDMAIDSSSITPNQRYCLDKNKNKRDINPTGWSTSDPQSSRDARSSTPDTVWCYGYDDHTWEDAAHTTATIDGSLMDIWYLRGNLSVDNDNYKTTLFGSNNIGGWRNNTYVAYQINGDNAHVQFRIRYDGEASTSQWDGEYLNVWRVADQIAGEDDIADLAGDTIVQQRYNTHHSIGNTYIDLRPPIVNIEALDTTNIQTSEILRVPWNATDDESGLASIFGEAEQSITSSALPIKDITALSNGDPEISTTQGGLYYPWITKNGVIGDTPFDSTYYLWNSQITNFPSQYARSEDINIGNNDEGGFEFNAFGVDRACNMSDNPGSSTFEDLFAPWMITKAGFVYSEGSVNIDLRDLSGSMNLCPDSNQSCSAFSNYPYNIARNYLDVTTEWIGSNQQLLGQVFDTGTPTKNHTRNNLFASSSYNDLNNQLWFEELREKALKNINKSDSNFKHISDYAQGTLPSKAANIGCPADKTCIVERNSNLNINSDFNCNRKVLLFVTGNLTIDGDISNNNSTNGCIFIVQGNVTIQDMDPTGSHKSPDGANFPRYDLIEAFIISDGQINIPQVDSGVDVRDGLKVHGGLLAFGGNPAVLMERSLKLKDNANYPTYILHHDTRYFEIAKKIFAGDQETFKKEIGFK